MRVWRIVIGLIIALCSAPVAHADIGGQVPGPGTCDYPNVGSQGMEFSVYHYECHGPIEENGSHWQAFYGGAAAESTLGGSLGIAFLTLNASISPTVGVLEGRQYWACPDLTQAEQPDPVGQWSTRKIGHPLCKTIGPKPPFLDQPPPQPIGPPNPFAPPPPPPDEGTPPAPPGPTVPEENTPNLPKAL